jgi:protocatechuate 3,4-dioxygenase beta subunit
VREANGAPAASLALELVAVPEHPMDELSLDRGFFRAETNNEGVFSFESVLPGKYLLGSNIIDQSTSRVPAIFYPGQRSRANAVPIDVNPRETTGGLILRLPDFGTERKIELCVVDVNGRPVKGARISAWSWTHGQLPNLGEAWRPTRPDASKPTGMRRHRMPCTLNSLQQAAICTTSSFQTQS